MVNNSFVGNQVARRSTINVKCQNSAFHVNIIDKINVYKKPTLISCRKQSFLLTQTVFWENYQILWKDFYITCEYEMVNKK